MRSLCSSATRWAVGALLACSLAGGARAEELVFLTWAEYLDPGIVAEFEAESGSSLKVVVFEFDEARDGLLVTQGPAAFDLILVNGATIAGYVRRGWLAPVPKSEMPNLVQLKPLWVDAYDQAEVYGVPYFWGTLGIAYRSDLVKEPFHSWRQLVQPDEFLRGRISMMGASRDLFTSALKMMQESLNVTDRNVIATAEALLQAQRPFVKTYVYLALTKDAPLVTGEVWASLMYNGGAKVLQGFEPSIEYVIPDEGTLLWADYITISSLSPHRQLALSFIDFLNRPEIAARNALFVRLATPNQGAEMLLPDEFRNDPGIYPTEETLQRSETHRPLSPRARKSLNESLIRLFH